MKNLYNNRAVIRALIHTSYHKLQPVNINRLCKDIFIFANFHFYNILSWSNTYEEIKFFIPLDDLKLCISDMLVY